MKEIGAFNLREALLACQARGLTTGQDKNVDPEPTVFS